MDLERCVPRPRVHLLQESSLPEFRCSRTRHKKSRHARLAHPCRHACPITGRIPTDCQRCNNALHQPFIALMIERKLTELVTNSSRLTQH